MKLDALPIIIETSMNSIEALHPPIQLEVFIQHPSIIKETAINFDGAQHPPIRKEVLINLDEAQIIIEVLINLGGAQHPSIIIQALMNFDEASLPNAPWPLPCDLHEIEFHSKKDYANKQSNQPTTPPQPLHSRAPRNDAVGKGKRKKKKGITDREKRKR